MVCQQFAFTAFRYNQANNWKTTYLLELTIASCTLTHWSNGECIIAYDWEKSDSSDANSTRISGTL